MNNTSEPENNIISFSLALTEIKISQIAVFPLNLIKTTTYQEAINTSNNTRVSYITEVKENDQDI